MKIYFTYLGLIFFIITTPLNCSDGKKTVISNNSENNQKSDNKNNDHVYLSIKLTCGQNHNSVQCKVIVFDVETRAKLIQGNTNYQGWFCSTSFPFAKDKKIKIEFWDSDKRCIGWLNYISYEKDPMWFVQNKEDVMKNKSSSDFHYHFGSCNLEDEAITYDIWGP